MFCIGLAMRLRRGAYEGYKLAHDQLWPEVAHGMRKNQVSVAIYADRERLFLFAAAPSEAHWQCSRQDAVLARWNAWMTASCQKHSGLVTSNEAQEPRLARLARQKQVDDFTL